MCAGTEKGVRERNLWASGKSQLSARRTPRAHILGTPASARAASPPPDDIMFRPQKKKKKKEEEDDDDVDSSRRE